MTGTQLGRKGVGVMTEGSMLLLLLLLLLFVFLSEAGTDFDKLFWFSCRGTVALFYHLFVV